MNQYVLNSTQNEPNTGNPNLYDADSQNAYSVANVFYADLTPLAHIFNNNETTNITFITAADEMRSL
jgi:hypothetical protein